MKSKFNHTFRLAVAVTTGALLAVPFFFGNDFFAPAAQAAPTISFITYTSGPVTYTSGATTIPSVYAREPITFTAGTTETAGLVFVWDFGDGESAIGDVGNNGSVTHLYDKAFTSTSTIQPTLRLYAATGTSPVATRGIAIRVEPLRLPADYGSMTPVQKAKTSDTWPFAHITRLDGPGPYRAGSQIDFRANASVRGFPPSSWKGSNTFEWKVKDSSRADVANGVVHASVDATGAFSATLPAAGWHEVSLRANQSNPAGSGFEDVYDTSSHAFFVTDNPAAVGSDAFSVDVTSTAILVNYSGQTEPFTFGSVNYRADAAVTGGIGPFTYTWQYPRDVKTDPQESDFIPYVVATFDSTNRLDAEFRRSGTKNIYLTVTDGTFRTATDTITHSITNTNAPAGTAPFSPTLNIAATPSPLLVALVEANNKPLTLQIGTGLTPPAQAYVFRATASNGTPPYQIQLSPANQTAAPCTQTATTLQCEYSFNAYGTFAVRATVTDGSNPSQSRNFTSNVVIQQQGAAPPPDGGGGSTGGTGTGGTGTGGAGTGGTGSGGISTGGATAASTPLLDPRASKYGLASTFSRVGIGQSDDLKSSIATIINIVLGFLGIIAVIFIIFGGFKMMSAAGNEDATASGKQAITAGIIGLLIIFAAWGIAAFVINNLASATA